MYYLDHAASTPLLPEVASLVCEYASQHYANPSGVYRLARSERRALDDARDELAEVLGCAPGEVVFTSGGTEADNLAISGAVLAPAAPRIVVSAIEHHGVLAPAEHRGAVSTAVTRDGLVDLDALAGQLDPSVGLVSVMAVNNEIGTVQPVHEIASLVRSRAPHALLHCDAVQALAWCDLAERVAEFDLVSVSAHKVGGPKGTGALLVRERARGQVAPILRGGAQERELRPGTENVIGIVAFARAASITATRRNETAVRVAALRDRFVDEVCRATGAEETVSRALRHPGNAHLRFRGASNEELLFLLDEEGVAASAGSACASGALEPSHVLRALGLSADEARSCVRFTLGWSTTAHEIEGAIGAVVRAHERLALSVNR